MQGLIDSHFLCLARRNGETWGTTLLSLVKVQQSRTLRSKWYQKIKFVKGKTKVHKACRSFLDHNIKTRFLGIKCCILCVIRPIKLLAPAYQQSAVWGKSPLDGSVVSMSDS